jgi:FMN reductase (NADPH)
MQELKRGGFVRMFERRQLMDVSEAINRRKSVRSYTGELPSREEQERILAAAQQSPVGMGAYDKFHLTVVTNPELLGKIDAAGAKFFNRPGMTPLYGAPELIIVSIAQTQPALMNAMYSSAAMVVHSMTLEATELGVGSCCIWGAVMAIPSNPDIMAALKLPESFTPCCGIALGKTDQTYDARNIALDRIGTNEVR